MNFIKVLEDKGYTVTEGIEAYIVEKEEAVVTLDLKHTLVELVNREGMFSSIDFDSEEEIIPSVELMISKF